MQLGTPPLPYLSAMTRIEGDAKSRGESCIRRDRMTTRQHRRLVMASHDWEKNMGSQVRQTTIYLQWHASSLPIPTMVHELRLDPRTEVDACSTAVPPDRRPEPSI